MDFLNPVNFACPGFLEASFITGVNFPNVIIKQHSQRLRSKRPDLLPIADAQAGLEKAPKSRLGGTSV